MKIILLGPPGAGKGTQAANIVDSYKIPHISTGDIFRKNIKEGTELGKKAQEYMNEGKLVPDELTCGLVASRLSEADCKDGFMLDGFPRNIFQAEYLDKYLSENNTSKEEGVCDSCHANLTQRPDDNEETVSHRIEVYLSETKPLVDYYTKQNVIANIEGNQDIDKVFEDIKAALA